MSVSILRSVVFGWALILGLNLEASAQVPGWDATGLQMTRPELQALLSRFDSAAASSAYSGAVRERAAAEAALIRQRLQEGDLRTGDRVVLTVEGHAELSDTFTVRANRSIVLPAIGEVPLIGVLRAELETHLTEQISRFIRQATVQARSLIRMEILGAVMSPGYYTVPSDVLLTDALMLAGGPQPDAAVDKVEIKRGGNVIWPHAQLRDAVIEGRTLDQLSVRAGDSIVVPERRSSWTIVRDGMLALSGLASLILLLTQL